MQKVFPLLTSDWASVKASNHSERRCRLSPDARCFYSCDSWKRLLWRSETGFSPFLSTASQMFYSLLPDRPLILSVFYSTVKRNVERYDRLLLTETTLFTLSSSSSTSPFLHPIVSSYTPPHLSFLGVPTSGSPPVSTLIGLNQLAWGR